MNKFNLIYALLYTLLFVAAIASLIYILLLKHFVVIRI